MTLHHLSQILEALSLILFSALVLAGWCWLVSVAWMAGCVMFQNWQMSRSRAMSPAVRALGHSGAQSQVSATPIDRGTTPRHRLDLAVDSPWQKDGTRKFYEVH